MIQTIIEAKSIKQLNQKIQESASQGWNIIPGSIQILNINESQKYACILQKEANSKAIFEKIVDGATVSITEQNATLVAKITDVKGELQLVLSTDPEGYPSVDISAPNIIIGEYDKETETFVSVKPDYACSGFNRPDGPIYVSIDRAK